MTVKVFQIVKETGFVTSMISFRQVDNILFGDNCFKIVFEDGEVIEYPRIGEYYDYSYIIDEVQS